MDMAPFPSTVTAAISGEGMDDYTSVEVLIAG